MAVLEKFFWIGGGKQVVHCWRFHLHVGLLILRKGTGL